MSSPDLSACSVSLSLTREVAGIAAQVLGPGDTARRWRGGFVAMTMFFHNLLLKDSSSLLSQFTQHRDVRDLCTHGIKDHHCSLLSWFPDLAHHPGVTLAACWCTSAHQPLCPRLNSSALEIRCPWLLARAHVMPYREVITRYGWAKSAPQEYLFWMQ